MSPQKSEYGYRMILPAVLMYGGLAAGLVWLGTGSILCFLVLAAVRNLHRRDDGADDAFDARADAGLGVEPARRASRLYDHHGGVPGILPDPVATLLVALLSQSACKGDLRRALAARVDGAMPLASAGAEPDACLFRRVVAVHAFRISWDASIFRNFSRGTGGKRRLLVDGLALAVCGTGDLSPESSRLVAGARLGRRFRGVGVRHVFPSRFFRNLFANGAARGRHRTRAGRPVDDGPWHGLDDAWLLRADDWGYVLFVGRYFRKTAAAQG